MTEKTEYLDINDEKILDLDANEGGGFIAFTNHKTVVTPDHKFIIDIELRAPIIRRLDDDKFLIADCRTNSGLNGHVYDFTGQKMNVFHLGDGIEDIIVNNGKIIVAYFDEGVFGKDGPNNDGVAVFDFEGNQEFGFNSSAIWGGIDDCYCICKHGRNKVLFYAYDALKVYELNLDTLIVEKYETPADFAGASAISSKQGKIILHSSYNDKRSFFLWDRDKRRVEKIGSYASRLKGIANGKFFAFGEKGYTIVDPTEYEF
ncbi:MAG TPA: hypothetical protein VFZ47_05305 [Chitinophagaceae bacterium]